MGFFFVKFNKNVLKKFYSIGVGLVGLELAVIRVLDEDVAAPQLGRRAAVEVVDHRDGGALFCHLQERLSHHQSNQLTN